MGKQDVTSLKTLVYVFRKNCLFNPLKAELNPICHLLALLGGATIVVVSRLRVNEQIANKELWRLTYTSVDSMTVLCLDTGND